MKHVNIIKHAILVLICSVGIIGWGNYLALKELRIPASVTYDKLSPEMTVSYVRAIVWYHSRGKLQEIRSILMTDNLENRSQIEIRLRNMLEHRSLAYIRDFNSINTPLQNLGTWYQQNFDFEPFLTDVYKAVFDNKLTVEDKVRNITDIMEEYQNITNAKLRDALLIK